MSLLPEISPFLGVYLYRTTQIQHKRRKISMPLAGFEPMTPVSDWVKIVHDLDSAATVIGKKLLNVWRSKFT
jgi:hypothetical protein